MVYLKLHLLIIKNDIDTTIQILKTIEFPRTEVPTVSTKTPYVSTGFNLHVVLVDFGKKQNIVRELNARGCEVTVVPYDTSAEAILNMSPDGVMLSNGPGDPEDVHVAIEMIQGILGKIPFFWHLLRTSTVCTLSRCNIFQNEIWTSWCQSSC